MYIVAFGALLGVSLAKTVTYDWDIDWVTASPDGFARPVIGINGQWPLQPLVADVGDTVVVNVKNSLGNETTGIHWHGMLQQGTVQMDGTSTVTQCPIPPGNSFTYTFTANPSGTSWFHSHNKGQYPDGLRAPMIIHDPQYEAQLGFDQEYIMTVSDWYHQQAPTLIHQYLSKDNLDNNAGAEPIPDSHLVNDGLSTTYDLEPGKKYLFRIVSLAAGAAYYIRFDDHNMTVIGLDNVQVKPTTTNTILITPGQRYDVLITAKINATKNYAFVSSMNADMFHTLPSGSNLNVDGVFRYNKNFPTPTPLRPSSYTPLDDATCQPLDGQQLLKTPDQSITLDVKFVDYSIGQRSQIGNNSWISPKVPSLYTALTTGDSATNPVVYGTKVEPYILQYDQVVQIVVNNPDDRGHPFHMHGHISQLAQRGMTQPFDGDESNFASVPMKRDVIAVPAGGYIVMRIKADNPGVWFFHCHIEWHVEGGMAVTFIEAPEMLQNATSIPSDHLAACTALGIPTQGNCGGKTDDFTDTSQCNNDFDPNPWGALINPPESYRPRRRAVPWVEISV